MKESREVVPLQSGLTYQASFLPMTAIDGATTQRAASQHLLPNDGFGLAVESAVQGIRIGYDKLKSRRVNLIC